MHLPDHYLSNPVLAITGIAAAAGLAALTFLTRRSSATAPRINSPWSIPLAGAVIFALQMLNYTVGKDVSGHVLGGVAAALLFGPVTAMWLMTSVLMVQAVGFGDGGILALGANILNMAIIAPWTGWLIARFAVRRGQGSIATLAQASFAGWMSVQFAALACGIEVAQSGRATPEFLPTLLNVHLWIGGGEALLTLAAAALVLRAANPARRVTTAVVLMTTLVIALAMAPSKSPFEDGLEWSAAKAGIAAPAQPDLGWSWQLSDYQISALANHAALSTIVAGVIGCAAMFVCGVALQKSKVIPISR
jgi:cobalt/nickel transport system permease protein